MSDYEKIISDDEVAAICKALGDPNRLKILRLLKNGELCGCKLLEALDINHSTLSHHMKILSSCHLVHARRVGKWCHYSINEQTFSTYASYIGNLPSLDYPNDGECCVSLHLQKH